MRDETYFWMDTRITNAFICQTHWCLINSDDIIVTDWHRQAVYVGWKGVHGRIGCINTRLRYAMRFICCCLQLNTCIKHMQWPVHTSLHFPVSSVHTPHCSFLNTARTKVTAQLIQPQLLCSSYVETWGNSQCGHQALQLAIMADTGNRQILQNTQRPYCVQMLSALCTVLRESVTSDVIIPTRTCNSDNVFCEGGHTILI